MIKVNFIGYGKWGRKIFPHIKKLKFLNVNLIKNRTNKIIPKSSWDFIFTQNKFHYQNVRQSLLMGKNVFCEKPLCLNLLSAKKLYTLSKKLKKNIYVCDIENFKNKKIKFKKENFIYRYKYSRDKKSILWRLFYHDLTYIIKNNKKHSISNIKIIKSNKGILNFCFILNKKKYNFFYNLNTKKRMHKFNNINLSSKKDFYKKMFTKLLRNELNYLENKNISLSCIKFINLIEKKIIVF